MIHNSNSLTKDIFNFVNKLLSDKKNSWKKKTKNTSKIPSTLNWSNNFKKSRPSLSSQKKNFLKEITKSKKWKNSKNWPLEIKTLRLKQKNKLSINWKNLRKNLPIERLIFRPDSKMQKPVWIQTTKSGS
jgi:hypothetical protein